MKEYKNIIFKFKFFPNLLVEIFMYVMEFLGLFNQ